MQKKKIAFYILLTLLIIILIVFSIFSFKNFKKNLDVKKCSQNIYNFDYYSPFSITKIVYFSSANCHSQINSNSSFTISDLYQYTDIAIFINTDANGTYTAKNTLKKVTLSDIKFVSSPSIGTSSLYFKNINLFTNNEFDENNKISDLLEFSTSSEDEIDFSQPILFNNCANPISLCYVNSDLKKDYTLSDDISNITYDGSLLKRSSITLNSLNCKISCLVTIINNLDETYTCPITLNIPLSTENSTIYDGSLILNATPNYKFVKNITSP